MFFRFKFPAPLPAGFSVSLSNFIISFFLCIMMLQKSSAQTTAPRTDPSEVKALNLIFEQWDVQIPRDLWNISGEPCTGTALGQDFDEDYNNPSIECDCTFDNNSTCHIIKFKVQQLNRQGVIPEELAALTYLTVSKIDQNSFTGTLPAFLGNFSSMMYLSLAHNQFSGTIPRELGNLKELIMLAISSNNFSGTLPPELGNLVNMRLLYLDSCGAGGEIPSTFARLTNMGGLQTTHFLERYLLFRQLDTVREAMFDIIEDYKGIIASFSNLTLSQSLIIRNALVSGPIPTGIIRLQKLVTLDLSFNNLNGSLPQTLMNMSSLVSLFLRNNSLTGSLLPDKSENLQNIDLSYNHLSGSFPRWVIPSWAMANLQLNLMANNFNSDSSNTSIFLGLNCLQRGFPCHRNTTPYTSFAIKCGGSEMRSTNNILFEAEKSTTLGPASYYVHEEKWAVSNGGIVIDRIQCDPVICSFHLNPSQ